MANRSQIAGLMPSLLSLFHSHGTHYTHSVMRVQLNQGVASSI